QTGSHCSPDTRPAENIRLNTGFQKGLVDAEVCATKRSAPAGDETYRLTREKAQQPRAVFAIRQRDVMVHEDVAARQPGASARYDLAACLVHQHQASCQRPMDGECELLNLIEMHRGSGRRAEQNRVSLTDALFGPVREIRVSDIEDEVGLCFQ